MSSYSCLIMPSCAPDTGSSLISRRAPSGQRAQWVPAASLNLRTLCLRTRWPGYRPSEEEMSPGKIVPSFSGADGSLPGLTTQILVS